jgi:hypothetical protein
VCTDIVDRIAAVRLLCNLRVDLVLELVQRLQFVQLLVDLRLHDIILLLLLLLRGALCDIFRNILRGLLLGDLLVPIASR